MNDWISVKDRLPNEEGAYYLVFIVFRTGKKNMNIEIAFWVGDIFFINGEYYAKIYDGEEGITHWMPLPDTPKE